jgi:hypothetical protein
VARPSNWHSLRDRVVLRDGACLKCGGGDELDVHHILPIDLGGSHHLGNLATLCVPCHEEATRLLVLPAGDGSPNDWAVWLMVPRGASFQTPLVRPPKLRLGSPEIFGAILGDWEIARG